MTDTTRQGNDPWLQDVEWPESRTQTIYDLAQLLAPGIPHHPFHPPFAFTLTKCHGDIVSKGGVSGASELIATGGHAGTHVDARNHVSRNGLIFGEHRVGPIQSHTGGIELESVDTLPPLVGPGHLVDGPLLLGRELTPADGIGAEELVSWFAGRTEPGPGSVVLLRTGWGAYWGDSRRYLGHETGAPGLTVSGARWLSERGVLAIGSDTTALEQMPNPELDVHVHCLVERGIPLMESMNLESVAEDGVHEFFFFAVALKIAGATGSPIRPLAFAQPEVVA